MCGPTAPDDPASQQLAARVRAQGLFVVTTLAYIEAITAQHVGTADCARPGSSANAAGALRALHRAGVPAQDYEKFADNTGVFVEV